CPGAPRARGAARPRLTPPVTVRRPPPAGRPAPRPVCGPGGGSRGPPGRPRRQGPRRTPLPPGLRSRISDSLGLMTQQHQACRDSRSCGAEPAAAQSDAGPLGVRQPRGRPQPPAPAGALSRPLSLSSGGAGIRIF
ncbi:PREDICTED: basic proline-rich protein-like, partial [Chinchilla lanigera]|uniref:basic proline-rich protein-like n=1 Tax=Chinchilla lanigera TaxID=34839 RepID=UPI000698DF6A